MFFAANTTVFEIILYVYKLNFMRACSLESCKIQKLNAQYIYMIPTSMCRRDKRVIIFKKTRTGTDGVYAVKYKIQCST